MNRKRKDKDNSSGGDPKEGMSVLRDIPGVTRMVLPAGQVLVYAGQVPAGIFLVLKGSIALNVEPKDTNGSSPHILDSKKGCFAFPKMTRLDEPLSCTASIKRKADLLFVPRSLILGNKNVRKVLEAV
jgi:CRP-like cAMP-binding protein